MPDLDASEAARAMAARRTKLLHCCPTCGIVFEAVRVARYCNDKCRIKAANKGRAERRRAGGTP